MPVSPLPVLYFNQCPTHPAALFLRELVPHHAADSRQALRAALFKRFNETKTCPFKNLPEARRGQWGEGLTAAEMEKCRWLKPRLVATIDYLERTVANHLRHAMFAGLTARQQ